MNVQFADGFARDDIGHLGATFKQMTVDLKTQRDDIMTSRTPNSTSGGASSRRCFAACPAGVIGVDPAGCVTLANRSARELLSLNEERLMGRTAQICGP